jgi:hypothetical protein
MHLENTQNDKMAAAILAELCSWLFGLFTSCNLKHGGILVGSLEERDQYVLLGIEESINTEMDACGSG